MVIIKFNCTFNLKKLKRSNLLTIQIINSKENALQGVKQRPTVFINI